MKQPCCLVSGMRLHLVLFTAGCLLLPGTTAPAATIVLANRGATAVEFDLRVPPTAQQHYKLPAAEIMAVRATAGAIIRFAAKEGQRDYELEPNSAHFFHRGSGTWELESIGFNESDSLPNAQAVAANTEGPSAASQVPPAVTPNRVPASISVKLLVDEEERASPSALGATPPQAVRDGFEHHPSALRAEVPGG